MASTITRTDLINFLITKRGYNSYLEIGVQDGKNLVLVSCKDKIGVDPDVKSKATIHVSSDQFFATNQKKFDLIFIDGLHHEDQCEKDVLNSLEALNEGGIIVCHDMNPTDEQMQIVPRIQKFWTGDVWKCIVKLRRDRRDLTCFVVDVCTGCGVIYKGESELPSRFSAARLTYKGLEKNRNLWLGLTSYENFKEVINSVGMAQLIKNMSGHNDSPIGYQIPV